MRTTVSLDDDVVSLLEEVRRRRKLTFKQAVNQALREGLATLDSSPQPAPFRTQAADLGRLLVASVDDVAEVLDLAEREDS